MNLLKSIIKYGFHPGIRKWSEQSSSPLAKYLENKHYIECFKRERPYFGKHLAASQGDPTRHKFMQRLVSFECQGLRAGEPFDILEIGSWAGGSAITWAEAIRRFHNGLGKVVCIDPWINYLDTNENKAAIYKTMEQAFVDDEIFHLFLHNIKTSGYFNMVSAFRGRSDELHKFFKTGVFRLVFLDGSHLYDDVINDLHNMTRLVCEGGILCGDDLELQSHQIAETNSVRINRADYILDAKTGQYFHPGVTLAVGDVIGDVSVWNGFWAARRKDDTWVRVDAPLEIEDGNSQIPEHLRKRF